MSKSNNTTTMLKILGIGIAVVQILDIIIHAATNQVEIFRVSSNIIVLLWLAMVASGRLNMQFLVTAFSTIGLYLLLNLIFLAREGIINVEQGGGLRVALFLLVLLTSILSGLLTYRYNNRLLT